MDLVNKKVMHEVFGQGNVVNYDDSYIKIDFKSGHKKFVFPDAFRKYITFVDQKAENQVNKRLELEEAKREKEELILQKEKALEEERQYILNQAKNAKSGKVHSVIQSVFWCEPGEEDEIFAEWQVFTGEIKSGKKKGQPRRLPRMNQNSACLITRRSDDMPEEDREILGLFMANDFFNGRLCKDGYIKAHPEYRIRLSQKESEKMLFWNYYVDERSPEKTVWNSGRQRYFDNILTAQILQDIVSLRKDLPEYEDAKAFFEYFCRINAINQDALPNANGALRRI